MDETVSPTSERLTVTIPAAGKMLGLSRQSAYEAAARGEIPTLRFGKRLVVPLKALHQLLEGGKK